MTAQKLMGNYRRIINALYASGNGEGTVKEVANAAHLHENGVARMLGTLAEHEVVERVSGENDAALWRLRPDSPHHPAYVSPRPPELQHARL